MDTPKKKKKRQEKSAVKKPVIENSSPVCYANTSELRKEYRD